MLGGGIELGLLEDNSGVSLCLCVPCVWFRGLLIVCVLYRMPHIVRCVAFDFLPVFSRVGRSRSRRRRSYHHILTSIVRHSCDSYTLDFLCVLRYISQRNILFSVLYLEWITHTDTLLHSNLVVFRVCSVVRLLGAR